MPKQTRAQLVKEVAALKRHIKLLERAVVSATVVANEIELAGDRLPRLADLLTR